MFQILQLLCSNFQIVSIVVVHKFLDYIDYYYIDILYNIYIVHIDSNFGSMWIGSKSVIDCGI